MQFSLMSGAAVLLALTPSVLSVGTAKVVNKCNFDVYYAAVSAVAHQDMTLLPAKGYSSVYSLPGVGVSIKIAPSASAKPTQFEYTWANGVISYDISNIDGNPFAKFGTLLEPSLEVSKAFPSCKPVVCPVGDYCDAAYNHPDDVRTMVCSELTDLTFTLCPNATETATATAQASTRVHARHFA